MDWLLNKLGYFKKKPSRHYKEIRYRTPGTPEENSKRLLHLTAQGNEWARNKEREDYQLIGMFFTLVLLIEHKMVNLLVSIDDQVENRMLSEKLEVFKDFLKMYNPEEDEDVDEYRLLLQPLNEIKLIRNRMAHNVAASLFGYRDLTQVDAYVKKRRPDMYEKFNGCIDEKAKCIGLLATFGFILSFEIAKLRFSIEH